MKRNIPSWIPTLALTVAIYLGVLAGKSAGLLTDYRYQVFQMALIMTITSLGLNLIYGFNGQFSLGHIGFYAIGAYASALITKDYVIAWSGSKAGALAWIMAAQIGLLAVLWLVRLLRLGALQSRIRGHTIAFLRPHEAKMIALISILAILAGTLALGILLIWGLHIALHAGLNALANALPHNVAQPIIFALAILNGGTMAAIVSYLVGLPLLRLGSDYFGIATLGFAVMVYTALQNSDLVIETMKGARGMVGIPTLTNWHWVMAITVLVVIFMRNLLRSSYGRALISVREDEIAAQTMGIDITQLKTLAFTIGGLFAGIGGALYAHLYGFLHPSSFSVVKGFDPLIIIVLGGLGSMTGTIIASIGVVVLIEQLRVVLPKGFEDWRFVIYPIILLLIMLFRSQGIMGTSEWGWLRAPLPPERDIPIPVRSSRPSVASNPSEDA